MYGTVVERLGGGWEGEVYRVRENSTGIERSLKLFFPQRNPRNRTVRQYAKKLHKLRHCSILIHYHNQEKIEHRGVSHDDQRVVGAKRRPPENLAAYVDRIE